MNRDFDITEKQPISHIQLRDTAYFSKIYFSLIQDIYAYGRSLNASKEYVEDAIQDIFAKIYESPRDFENVKHLKFFLLQSLKHRIYDRYRKESRLSELDDFSLTISVNPSVLEKILESEEQNNLNHRIETLLNTLSPNQKKIIYLRYMQGMEYNEISALLNTEPAAIRKMASRAILKLRKDESFSILFYFFF